MRRTIVLLLLALIASCGDGTQIRIHNDSSQTLSNLSLKGRGFAVEIGSIAPGETRVVVVRPEGESGLAMTFNAGGRRISVPASGYFEGGGKYVVDAAVKKDLSVDVISSVARRSGDAS